jgi:hypothetical protein
VVDHVEQLLPMRRSHRLGDFSITLVGVAIHIRDCLLIGVYDFIDDRAKWLKAAAMAFNLIYKTSEREEQQSPSELKAVGG